MSTILKMCGCLAQREMFRMKRLFSLSWNKQDSPLCLYYNHNACHCFPVPEPLALLHLCTYVCVRMCVWCFTIWTDQLLDALLHILNIWLSLLADLGPDVKSSAAHLRF